VLVALDTAVTPELRAETARELVRRCKTRARRLSRLAITTVSP
jgi:hypothetical protein